MCFFWKICNKLYYSFAGNSSHSVCWIQNIIFRIIMPKIFLIVSQKISLMEIFMKRLLKITCPILLSFLSTNCDVVLLDLRASSSRRIRCTVMRAFDFISFKMSFSFYFNCAAIWHCWRVGSIDIFCDAPEPSPTPPITQKLLCFLIIIIIISCNK